MWAIVWGFAYEITVDSSRSTSLSCRTCLGPSLSMSMVCRSVVHSALLLCCFRVWTVRSNQEPRLQNTVFQLLPPFLTGTLSFALSRQLENTPTPEQQSKAFLFATNDEKCLILLSFCSLCGHFRRRPNIYLFLP